MINNGLLHTKKSEKVEEPNLQESDKKQEEKSVENSHTSPIIKAAWPKNKISYIFLPTLIWKKGSRKTIVNALLDDGSTTTYFSSNVVTELKLCGKKQKVTAHILNGPIDSFETAPVGFQLELLDGKVNRTIQVFIANHVTFYFWDAMQWQPNRII